MSEQTRRLLLTRRVEAEERLRAVRAELSALMAASADTNADDEHDPEGATIGFERAQLATLELAAVQSLREVGQALERLASNTYGACSRCGVEIAADRLQARPTADLCISCATTHR